MVNMQVFIFVVFPQAPFRVRMFPGFPGIIQLRNAPWPPEESRRWLCYSMCIGEVVWSFMFAVELAGSYLGHVPCKFWKVCIGLSIFHRSIMEGNWPALDVVHASVITDLFAYWACSFCIVGSQQQWYGCSYEKSLWSYRARWRCRYLYQQLWW